MSTLSLDRTSWLGSIRTRVAILAFLVVAVLIGGGVAFVSVLGNRESAIIEEAKNHLLSAALGMARDYAREDFQAQSLPPLENADVQASDDVLSTVTTGVLQSERGSEGGGEAAGIFTLLFQKTGQGWKVILDHTS